MKNIIKIAAISALTFNILSCKKEEKTPSTTNTPKPSTVVVEFENKVGTADLKMDGTNYTNAAGETFTVSKFNYYISGVRLNTESGGQFTETESYHLIQQSDTASLHFDLVNVPSGSYNSITFTIGVDSARNVSGAQTGALDPINGMFWSWSTGYIMMKLEGSSPQSTAAGNKYQLHAGGFKGNFNTVRTITLSLPSAIKVDGGSSHIHLSADVLKVLGGTSNISFATTPVIMSAGANSNALANNYQNMFTVENH